MNAKAQFADVWTKENATTRRVLHSVPPDRAEFQPSANTKPARELAFIFSHGQLGVALALSGKWVFPPQYPPTPATWGEVLTAFDATTTAVRCRPRRNHAWTSVSGLLSDPNRWPRFLSPS